MSDFRKYWSFPESTIYLNHGSFGPPPRPVIAAQRIWQDQLNSQPMDFFVRRYEPAWRDARRALGRFVGANPENLAFVENSTSGMNVVANSLRFRPNDEILLTDHEYGAVERIWHRVCALSGASLKVARLPERFVSGEDVVQAITKAMSVGTRLLVVSHITSATAVTLPVADICRQASSRGIPVCIDGAHAVAQLPLQLEELGCDFYTASCHKWLSAPFGSGFIYVQPRYHDAIRPTILSWGRLRPNKPECWSDEFIWTGARDPSAFLAVSSAIQFLRESGLERFRSTTHDLARYARQQLAGLTGLEPLTADENQWYGCMAHVPLPPGDGPRLQRNLWERYAIEVPIIQWGDRRFVRVSCHLYTRPQDIDRLVGALGDLLKEDASA